MTTSLEETVLSLQIDVARLKEEVARINTRAVPDNNPPGQNKALVNMPASFAAPPVKRFSRPAIGKTKNYQRAPTAGHGLFGK